ncbi:hypothetical protein BSU04_01965 [Caballeronia sordidicola]|uniref:Uncharacterized protein n=1 Tax=Caballeronia sordidicola TaxID=196367 RepID=A0A226XBA1_CABSO|nr:hypothetical protein BSU04_01965 [Caballeronia sordidicola]
MIFVSMKKRNDRRPTRTIRRLIGFNWRDANSRQTFFGSSRHTKLARNR